jgi:hypothetical protein
MARSSKMSAQKRLRERQKAEKAEAKREARRTAQSEREPGARVAQREDLEGYGVVPADDGRESGG